MIIENFHLGYFIVGLFIGFGIVALIRYFFD